MTSQPVQFASTSGPLLSGVLEVPEGPVKGWGVFSHGLTLGKDSPAASRISKGLAAAGIGMLRFDNLGLGGSGGDWADSSFSLKVADTVAATRFLAEQGKPVSLLVGHSFGGAAVLAAAEQCPDVRAVATVGAPYEPQHAEHNFQDIAELVMDQGEAEWRIGGRELTLRKGFIDDLRATDLSQVIGRLRTALLILHDPQDEMVPITNAQEIFFEATHPRSFVDLEGAGHFLTGKGQAARAARIIAAWAESYLAPIA
ncbi:alpha/beta hydrolase family protein [Microbacterium stercoris]|uniref:Alpha/beta fold hydrolase n=1 Tax=Microbacterium stercoris TaxID=2820289 RepID=A0A939TQ82_9MICO|nr:alpha/beta fold hydrolase [Microbacterium stercoris]MBO3663195.1 alpha/beta fold hydrolase [Microbacterium stercoris]